MSLSAVLPVLHVSSYALWFVTPVLGALRNYAKYRTFNPVLFIRTPVLTGLLYVAVIRSDLFANSTAILVSAISERWVLLAYKMSLSFYYDDFRVKKAKYIFKGHIQG